MVPGKILNRLPLWACLLFPLAAFPGEPHQVPSHLLFAENKGQWDEAVKFRADLKGGALFLGSDRLTYVFFNQQDVASLHPGHGTPPSTIHLHAFRVILEGAAPAAPTEAGDMASWRNNYFLGNDPSRWAADVPLYHRILYTNIYPGIDMQVSSYNADPKVDYIVHPGQEAARIAMRYEGADSLSLDHGKLKIITSVGDIVEQEPYAWQWINGHKTEVSCSFRLEGNTVRFFFPGGYRTDLPLTIDPTLVFSSYTGSTADNWGYTATYDNNGNAFGGGIVHSLGYPVTTGAYQLSFAGGNTAGNGYSCDMAIAKFSSDGTTMLYATYLGGNSNEQPQSLVADNNGDLYVFGTTYSSNFPVTAGTYSQTKNGNADMVISKLSPNGNSLLASTFIGGNNDDGVNTSASFTTGGPIKYNYGDDARGEIVLSPAGDVVVSSCTRSANFPVTTGAFQASFGGGGQDGVIFKMNPGLTSLLLSTFLGGSGMDATYSCVFDGGGNIYATGGTTSTNFPTTSGTLHPSFQGGSADGYIVHLSANGSLLLQGTYIGTPDYDQTFFVQLDATNNVYTTGQTEGNYPVTAGVYANANSAQFIHKLSPDLSTTSFSTVFGNGSSVPNISPTAFLVDTCGNIYVSGWGRCNLAGAGYTIAGVSGMALTSDALQSSTDGCDFYFIVLSRDALALQYGTFFGGPFSEEHVDGGTSRFDANGVIYQSVCAGCGGNSDFPTTPGVVSNTNNSTNCNNAVMKLRFNLSKTRAFATGTPLTGCPPLAVQFTNNSVNGITYTWDFDDGTPRSAAFQPSHTFADTGVHHVMLISRNNLSCNIADTTYIPVIVTPPPGVTASMTLVPSPGCDSLDVLATSTGSGGNAWTWRFGDGGQATGLFASHTYASPGNYSVTLIVRDTVCVASDTAVQPVNLRRILDVDITPATAFGCAPHNLTLSSGYSGSGTLQWAFGDGDTAAGNPVTHLFTTPGNYSVRLVVTDTSSCNVHDTAWYSLDVFATPKAGFVYDLYPEYWPGRVILFTDTSLFASRLQWNFGDQSVATDSVVSHSFRHSGLYSVCLVATNDEGCTDSACRTIEVSSTESLYVPNSFTPNHDGNNDTFFPVTAGILDMNVRIYNRWGQLVAEWNGLDGYWDGNYKGVPAEKDVYIYEIHAVGSVTNSIVRTGRVTLVR